MRLIVLHYTGTASAQEAEDVYLGPDPSPPSSPVSPHYMVGKAGEITRYVPETLRAWHCGRSFWRGMEDLNSLSIGIELVNGGHEGDYTDFPLAQRESLVALCRDILSRHPSVVPENILAHSDIAPSRKQDPGERFDWQWFAREGIGFWPDMSPDIIPVPREAIDAAILAYGYDPQATPEHRLRAFQRHYVPEHWQTGGAGDPDLMITGKRLGILLAHSKRGFP